MLKIEIDPKALSVGDLIDLEEAKSAAEVCRWLVKNAGVSMDELRALPAAELSSLGEAVAASIQKAIAPKK